MFSGLQWDFPIVEMSGYLGEHMALIMPLLLLIVGVLLALLVVEGITDAMLKVIAFVAGTRTTTIGESSRQHPMELDLDEPEFD